MPWLLSPVYHDVCVVHEGGAHVHEGAVREIMAGDEYGWLAADPEGDDWSMSSVETTKSLGEGGRRDCL